MPAPSQRQPRHPNSLSQFVGPRRFELASPRAFDLSGPELELVGQRFYGIVLPGVQLRVPLEGQFNLSLVSYNKNARTPRYPGRGAEWMEAGAKFRKVRIHDPNDCILYSNGSVRGLCACPLCH